MPPIVSSFQRLSTIGRLPGIQRAPACHDAGEQRHTPRVRPAFAFALLVLAAVACADPTETTTTTGNAPGKLEIRCDGEAIEVLTPTVQAQRDGVHVLIHNS